jgi:hypothetical protein
MPDDIARAEERCMERLKSKKQVLETAYDFDTARLEEKCERLQKQLDIAVEALESYQEDRWAYEDEYYNYPPELGGGWVWAEQALKQIEELNK